jgi:hypothetical protein
LPADNRGACLDRRIQADRRRDGVFVAIQFAADGIWLADNKANVYHVSRGPHPPRIPVTGGSPVHRVENLNIKTKKRGRETGLSFFVRNWRTPTCG